MIFPRATPAALFVLLACSHAQEPAPGKAPPNAARADALAAFETVRTVLQSPRCLNCHPAGDQPLQGDDSHVHLQFVQRGPEGRGVAGLGCATCHGKANPPDSYGEHMPPGVATEWRLPPPQQKMVFAGLSSHDLCEQLKDPHRNGAKDPAALFHHMSEDAITLWGWSPGYGRKPVAIPHDDFVRAFKTWQDAGFPCAPAANASNP
ncbi:MAG: Isoquinoline 1-oxidoreductase subunit [Myxococcales bacterium]